MASPERRDGGDGLQQLGIKCRGIEYNCNELSLPVIFLALLLLFVSLFCFAMTSFFVVISFFAVTSFFELISFFVIISLFAMSAFSAVISFIAHSELFLA